jgi:hypothetical protein
VCKEIFGTDRLQVAVKQLIQQPSATTMPAASGTALPPPIGGGPSKAPQGALPALLRTAVSPLGGLPPLQSLGALAPVPVGLPDASRKRPLPAQGATQPQARAGGGGSSAETAKRARLEGPAALTDGYSMAAAAADEATATGADKTGDKDGSQGPETISRGFDIFQVAGVDMTQEEEALGTSGYAVSAPGAAPAVAEQPWAERIATTEMRERLKSVCGQCGVDGLDDGAMGMLAEGLGERLSGLLGTLRQLAEHRLGAHKELFGSGAFRVSLDPKTPWRKRVADEARAAVQPVVPVPPRPAVRAPRASHPSRAEDERVMAQMVGLAPSAGGAACGQGSYSLVPAGAMAAGGAAGGHRAPSAVSVTAIDVLWQLEQEPQSGRSRVLQWWRCEGRPLRRYARRSARLYIAQVRSTHSCSASCNGLFFLAPPHSLLAMIPARSSHTRDSPLHCASASRAVKSNFRFGSFFHPLC